MRGEKDVTSMPATQEKADRALVFGLIDQVERVKATIKEFHRLLDSLESRLPQPVPVPIRKFCSRANAAVPPCRLSADSGFALTIIT